MAQGATVHAFSVELADVDRNTYATLDLRMARHPSETPEFLLTRLLAYCLEYTEGIVFTDGVGAVDEPAVLVRDLTGQLTAWIEVGAPSAERLHKGAKAAKRCAVYTSATPSSCSSSIPNSARASSCTAPPRSRSIRSAAASSRAWPQGSRGAARSPCRGPRGSCTWTSTA